VLLSAESPEEQDICVDVSIASPFYYAKNEEGQAHERAVLAREAEKRKRYDKPCHQQGLSYEPFVLDWFGSLGPSAQKIIRWLAARTASKAITTPAQEVLDLKQDLLAFFNRCLARAILSRDSVDGVGSLLASLA